MNGILFVADTIIMILCIISVNTDPGGKPEMVAKPKIIKIYRIENKLGFGPYRANPQSEIVRALLKPHQISPIHPSIQEDGITIPFTGNAYCGFSSKTKLKKWFDKKIIASLMILKLWKFL